MHATSVPSFQPSLALTEPASISPANNTTLTSAIIATTPMNSSDTTIPSSSTAFTSAGCYFLFMLPILYY